MLDHGPLLTDTAADPAVPPTPRPTDPDLPSGTGTLPTRPSTGTGNSLPTLPPTTGPRYRRRKGVHLGTGPLAPEGVLRGRAARLYCFRRSRSPVHRDPPTSPGEERESRRPTHPPTRNRGVGGRTRRRGATRDRDDQTHG